MDDLGAKILSNINSAFKKDPKIDEFDVLPVLESTQNKNPVILVEHKLALEAWAAKLVYNYAYKKLMNWRMLSTRPKSSEREELLCLTRAVLMVTADCATVWNIRKELYQRYYLNAVDELKLAELILSKHPKSPETFTHRKWLFEQLQNENQRSNTTPLISDLEPPTHITDPAEVKVKVTDMTCPTNLVSIVTHEMRVCEAAAERYANNYNAWSHRIWTIQNIANCDKKIIQDELDVSHRFVSTHVSDHSGFHFRQFLMQQLHQHLVAAPESDVITSDVKEELELSQSLISLYSGHEAIWYHRRFLVTYFLKTQAPTLCGSSDSKRSRKKTKRDTSDYNIIHEEEEFCNQILADQKEAEWQKTLATKQLQWLEQLDL